MSGSKDSIFAFSYSIDLNRAAGYADIRELATLQEKVLALLDLVPDSRPTIASFFGVHISSVRRAAEAQEEHRDIGRNGRPGKLRMKDEKSLYCTIKEKILNGDDVPANTIRAEVFETNHFAHLLYMYSILGTSYYFQISSSEIRGTDNFEGMAV